MSANKPPEVTPPCCEVWTRILDVRWYMLSRSPTVRVMPYLHGTDGREFCVNFCPSCGAPRRDAVEVDG